MFQLSNLSNILANVKEGGSEQEVKTGVNDARQEKVSQSDSSILWWVVFNQVTQNV